ncbi:hypothetical protein Tco_0398227 [Tanacetum coccineum]
MLDVLKDGGNGGRGVSMSGVGEGKVDSMGGMRGGLLAIRSMVSNDGRGGRGLVVEGGSSSKESIKALASGGVDLGSEQEIAIKKKEVVGRDDRREW